MTMDRDERRSLEREVAAALVATMSDDHPDNDEQGRRESTQRCLEILPEFSDETLELFKKYASTNLGEELLHLMINRRDDERYLVDWILINPYSGVGRDVDVHYTVASLPYYKGLVPFDDYARRSEQTRAIFKVCNYLANLNATQSRASNGSVTSWYKFIGEPAVIANDELRAYLVGHESPSTVAEVISSRGITDIEQIEAVIRDMRDSPAPLNDGTL